MSKHVPELVMILDVEILLCAEHIWTQPGGFSHICSDFVCFLSCNQFAHYFTELLSFLPQCPNSTLAFTNIRPFLVSSSHVE